MLLSSNGNQQKQSLYLFYKKTVLQNLACNFIKKRLQNRCFAVNIAKFLRTPILKNFCERLFLKKLEYLTLQIALFRESEVFNSLQPGADFLYPLKTSENFQVFKCFQEVYKHTAVTSKKNKVFFLIVTNNGHTKGRQNTYYNKHYPQKRSVNTYQGITPNQIADSKDHPSKNSASQDP